jgi:hypothetical protein
VLIAPGLPLIGYVTKQRCCIVMYMIGWDYGTECRQGISTWYIKGFIVLDALLAPKSLRPSKCPAEPVSEWLARVRGGVLDTVARARRTDASRRNSPDSCRLRLKERNHLPRSQSMLVSEGWQLKSQNAVAASKVSMLCSSYPSAVHTSTKILLNSINATCFPKHCHLP